MKNPSNTLVLFLLAYSYLCGQSTTFNGKTERIIENCTTGTNYCCTPNTSPGAIYATNIQVNNLTSGVQNNTTTNSTGLYSVTTAVGLVTINASAGTQYIGLSVSDIARINLHRNLTTLLACPLTRIAADVDNDGKITANDGTLIQQYTLGQITSFPVPPWRFVPKNYVNPSSVNPDPKFTEDFWNNAYSNNNGVEHPFNAVLKRNGKSYTYNGSSSWMTKLESAPLEQYPLCDVPNFGFYGIASGDVNCSASTANVPFAPEPEMGFDRIVMAQNNLRSADERYEVKISAVVTEEVDAYQLGIKFDEKNYQFEKIKPEKTNLKQDDRNFGVRPEQVDKGELRVLWYNDRSGSQKGISANQEFDVFTFNLKVKKSDTKLEESILIDDKILNAEFVSLGEVIPNDKVKLILKIRSLRPDEE